jgi:hypothetical protein
MVGIAVDQTSPFNRRSGMLLDPGHYLCRGSLEVHARVFRGQDDLENSLVSGFLPAFSQRTKLVFLRQAKSVWIRDLAVDCDTHLLLNRQAVALGALSLDVGSMRLPSPRRPGGRIADIDDGAALEGRRFRESG